MEDKSREQFQKLIRLYAMAGAINHLIVRAGEPQAIFDGACHIAVERGDFRMAWLGMLQLDGNEKILRPVASAGMSNDHLSFLKINSARPLTAARPCAQAALSGKPQLCNNIRNNPTAQTWRDAALKRDYRSAVAFPLKIAGETMGVFVLYAAKDYFEMGELHLLDEVAAGISFALEYHRCEQERRRAVEQLRASEERFRLLAGELCHAQKKEAKSGQL